MMLGKALVGALGLFGVYEGFKWYKKNKAAIAVLGGHAYSVTFDYTKAPVSPMTMQLLQSQIDAIHPGLFSVIAASMVSNAKQVAATLVVTGGDSYIAGSDLLQGWPAGFGTVTLDSVPKDMGAGGAGTAAAPVAGT
jgi:hypothetical protein